MNQVDVIIPVYKPDRRFIRLVEQLERQSVSVGRIIIVNTEQKYFDRLMYWNACQEHYTNIVVRHISKREFDHGGTRNRALRYSDAPYFVMMTQDAVPADEHVLEELLLQLHKKNIAVAYARQLAAEDSGVVERFTRNFNYPDESRIKTEADLETLGVKTFFCSNVCAAYRRDIFDTLGGFIKHTIFNEDMIYAAKAVKAGYGIAYTAEAKVYHSHEYTNREQFRRNFDLGVSQADHPEVFAAYPSESEGIRLVRETVDYLKSGKQSRLIPHVIMQSGCKYMGYLLGKHYRKLPKKLTVALSSNKEYWARQG